MIDGFTKEDILGTEEINPTNNLPDEVDTELSTFTADDIKLGDVQAQDSDNAYLGKGDFGLDQGDFDFQLKYDADNQDIRANEQSVGGMLAKGTGRLITTTITKALAGLGYVATAIPALISNDMSVMLDNGWSNVINNMEESAKETMPIYKTKAYQKGDILTQMGTLGFWMDDAIDGAAFMLSSIVGAKGLSKLGSTIGGYSKLAKTVSTATKAAKLGKDVSKFGNVLKLKKFVDGANLATISTFNTVNEAAFEAKDTKDSVLRSLQNKIDLGEITQEEANLKASEAAKTTFWTNMVILTPSNLFETSMLFKTAGKTGINKIIKEGRSLGKTSAEIAGELNKKLTKKEIFSLFGKNSISTAIVEANEENMQTAIQNYTTNRALDKDNRSLIQGMTENWAENFSTDEGQKSMALGAIIGLLPGGIGGVKQAQSLKKLQANQAAAIGARLTMASTGIKDFFKHEEIKDDKGNVVGHTNNLLTDDKGSPIEDVEKMKGIFKGATDSYLNYMQGIRALITGNVEDHEIITHKAFSDYAHGILAGGGDLETLELLTDEFAQTEIEDLKEVGILDEESETKIDETKQKYKDLSKQLYEVYESVVNNYAGLRNFGKDEVALNFKNKLIYDQYLEASKQIYLNNKIDELEKTVREGELAGKGVIEGVSGLKSVDATESIKKGKEAAKKLKIAKDGLLDSHEAMKDLLDNKKQKEIFSDIKQILKKEKEGKDVAESDPSTASKAAITKVEGATIKLSDDTEISKITPEVAEKNGFVLDEARSTILDELNKTEGSGYYSKVDKDQGLVHILYTDPEGNITSDRHIYGKEATNPVTNELGRVSLNYLNGKLDKASTYNFETGETTYHDIATIKEDINKEPTTEDSDLIFNNAIPNQSGWEYLDGPTVLESDRIDVFGQEGLVQKTLDQHRSDVEDGFNNKLPEVVKEVETKKDEIAKYPDKYEKVRNNLFSVSYNPSERGYPIKIQGKNYRNPFVSRPLDAIRLGTAGIVDSVTLVDEGGNHHVFTNPLVTNNIANIIDRKEAQVNEIFEKHLFGNNSDGIAVADPKTGIEYGVFRKNNQYEVYFLREGEKPGEYKKLKPKSKIRARVMAETRNLLNDAISKATSGKIKDEKGFKNFAGLDESEREKVNRSISRREVLKNSKELRYKSLELIDDQNQRDDLRNDLLESQNKIIDRIEKEKINKNISRRNVLKRSKELRYKIIEIIKKEKAEIRRLERIKNSLNLSDLIGKYVIYDGNTYLVNREGNHLILENENRIVELEDDKLINLNIFPVVEGIAPYKEQIKTFEQYDIEILNENAVVINNNTYYIKVDDKGNIIGLHPENKPDQLLKNKSLLIAVEIERNKTDYDRISPDLIEDEKYEEIKEENPNLDAIEGIYNINFTQTVADALDKLYSKKELSDNERLQLDLWVVDAINRMTKLYVKNPNSHYAKALDNLELINVLLYTNSPNNYEKRIKEASSNDAKRKRINKPRFEYRSKVEDILSSEDESFTETLEYLENKDKAREEDFADHLDKVLEKAILDNAEGIRDLTPAEALVTPSNDEIVPTIEPTVPTIQPDPNTQSIEEEIVEKAFIEAAIEEEAIRRLGEQERDTEKLTEVTDLIKQGDSLELMSEDELTEEEKKNIINDAAWKGTLRTNDTISYYYVDAENSQTIVKNRSFLLHAINNNVRGATVEAQIDFSYSKFWDSRPRLRAAIEKGLLTPDLIEATLTSIISKDSKDYNSWVDQGFPEFDRLVDFIPIKYVYRDVNGNVIANTDLFAHQSNFKYIVVPEDVENPVEYKKSIMAETRAFRAQILKARLSGNKVEIKVSDKTAGYLNTVGENTSLANIINQLGDSLKDAKIGLGLSEGEVSFKGDKYRSIIGSKGGVYWKTNRTANGESRVIKLNPNKISPEHAMIILKALRQYNKADGLAEYEGNEVTGGLTAFQVLNLLVDYGQKNTQVKADNKSKARYLNKQLWTTKDGLLKFGENMMNLHDSTKEEEAKFIDWITKNKNYAVSKVLLDENLPNKRNFRIGNFEYNAKEDNYNSFILKSGMLQTRVRVVDGTKSVTTNPVVILNPESISTTKTTQAAKPNKERLQTVVDDTIKVTEGAQNEVRLKSLDNLFKLRDMSMIYFYAPGISSKIPFGFVNGDVITRAPMEYKDSFADLNRQLARYPNQITKDDLNDLKDIMHPVFVDYLYADMPAATVEDKTEDKEADRSDINDSFENDGTSTLDELDDGLFRLVNKDNTTYEKGNVSKAVKWLRSKLGEDFDIYIVNGLIELANDKHAFGQARVDSIRLSNEFEVGTEYHEAFHRVSRFLLDKETRDKYYESAKKYYKLDKNISEKELEEFLAEKFRDYVLLKEEGTTPKSLKSKAGSYIKRLFDKIYNYIKSIFTGKNKITDNNILKLFAMIDAGKFKNKTVEKSKLKSLQGEVWNFTTRKTPFDNIQSGEEYKEVIQYLYREMAMASGLITVGKDISGKTQSFLNIENGVKDLNRLSYSNLKKAIAKRRNSYQSFYINNKDAGKAAEETRNAIHHAGQILNELLSTKVVDGKKVDVFNDVIKKDLEDFLRNLNTVAVDNESLDNNDDPNDDTGKTNSDFEVHSRVSFEYSGKHSNSADIKLLLSILPESNERSAKTGLPKFAEFSKMWSKLLSDNVNVVSIDDMMDNLEGKSKDFYPYQVLLNYVKSNEIVKGKLFNVVSQSRLYFVSHIMNNDKGEIKIDVKESMLNDSSERLVKDWNTNFLRNPNLFKNESGVGLVANTENFNALRNMYLKTLTNAIKEYQGLIEIEDYQFGYSDIFNNVMYLLNNLGINISNKELDYILANKGDNMNENLVDFLNEDLKYIFGEKGTIYALFNSLHTPKKVNFNNAFSNEKSIYGIAKNLLGTDEIGLGDSHVGPEGKKFYLITPHTTLTNEVNQLQKDAKSYTDAKMTAVFNKNSMYLKYFNENPSAAAKFQLKTQSTVLREGIRDRGRGYQDVSPIEEYLIRLNSNNNGYATPPTPESRRFYQFFKNVPRVGNNITGNIFKRVVTVDNALNVDMDTVETFLGYYQDEINRRDLTRSQVDKAIAYIEGSVEEVFDPANLIQDIHFTHAYDRVADKGDVIIADNANGEWVILKEGESAIHGNGKLVKSNSKYNGVGANMVIFTDHKKEESKEDYIKRILRDRIQASLDNAVKLGIVQVSENYYYNKFIPKAIMDKFSNFVGTNVNTIIKNIIADNTVNTIATGIEMLKVFNSDIATYGEIKKYIKRLTGYTSTGSNLRTNYPADVYANDELIRSDQFTTTTFNSHIVESSIYDEVLDNYIDYYSTLKDDYGKDLYTLEQATEISKRKLIPFLKLDQTDAQTFITPEMHRAIKIKLSEWSAEKEEAYQIMLQPDWENDPINKLKVQSLVEEPLKLIYMKNIQENGQSYTVMDKMSLSTLYRPMVRGTQLEELLDRMEGVGKYAGKAKIHQVKFTTAQKLGGKDMRNFFSDSTEASLTDLNIIKTYEQDFQWLRKQLVTDPHDSTTIKIGTQMLKVGMSNVDQTAVYDNVMEENEKFDTGADLIREVNDVISNLSDRGVIDVKERLKLTSKLKVVDKQAFSEMLEEEAKKANMPQNIVDSISYDEVTGESYLDVDTNPAARVWFQSRVVSVIKKATVDIELPGNAFIQMSDIGLRKDGISRSDELKWNDESGYIQAKVSVNLFKHIIPNYENKNHDERVEFLNKNKDLVALAYRVPTQGQNSTYAIKIVGWLPENQGDSIILPKEGPGVGGFDFDIDKLYVVRHNYIKGKRVKYLNLFNSKIDDRIKVYARKELRKEINDIYKQELESSNIAFSEMEDYEDFADQIKTADLKEARAKVDKLINDWITEHKPAFEKKPIHDQNITEAVQNRLIDLYLSVWHNKNHYVQRMQPLGDGTERIKAFSNDVRKWEQQVDISNAPLSFLSPDEQLAVKLRFSYGSQGIAPYAMGNVHHILGQSSDLQLPFYLGVGNKVDVETESEILVDPEDIVDEDIRYELFPGVTANKEQKIAIDAAIEFIKDDSIGSKEYFTLVGKAGTGKTTIIKKVLEQFPKSKMVVGALSNKAKDVLATSINDVHVNDISFHSIAGMLNMKRDVETGDFVIDKYSKKKPPIASADIIVVDEASMVNESALDNLLKIKKPNAKLIFLGDSGQLPPIRRQDSPLKDAQSKVFGSEHISKLLERVRQGEESPILPFADKYWNNSQSNNPTYQPFSDDERYDRVTKEGNLIFTKSDFIWDTVVDEFKKSIDEGQPNRIRIVGYRNTTIDKINEYIHNRLFKGGDRFNKGENIIFNAPYAEDDLTIDNASEFPIDKVEKRSFGDDLSGYDITLTTTTEEGLKGQAKIPVLDDKSKIRHKQIVSALFNEASALPKGYERKEAYKIAWDENDRYANISHSYAITSHKSQGSTYNTTVVLEDDIMGVTPTTNKAKSQSMYTAITRSRNNTVMVSNKNVNATGEIPLIAPKKEVVSEGVKKEDVGSTEKVTQKVTSKESFTSLSKKIGQDKEFITEWFSGALDGNLDMGTDPFIANLNVNDYTNPVIMLLFRAGVGGIETLSFAAQPILKEIAVARENVTHLLDEKASQSEISSKKGSIAKEIFNKYVTAYVSKGGKKSDLLRELDAVKGVISDQNQLHENIKDFGKGDLTQDYYMQQLNVYNAFTYLTPWANELNEAVMASRVDNKKIGSNLSEVSAYDKKSKDLIRRAKNGSGIKNFDKMMSETYLSTQSKNSIDLINGVASNTLLEGSESFQALHDAIIKATVNTEFLTDRTINDISKGIYTEIVSKFFVDVLGYNTDRVSKMFTGNNSIAKQIDDIKLGNKWPHLKSNPMFNSDYNLFYTKSIQDGPDLLSVNKLDDPFHVNDITNGWLNLLEDPNEEINEFARDLYVYSYFTSGFKTTANSFYQYAPVEIVKDSGLNEYIKNVKKNMHDTNLFSEYLDDTIANMWDNDTIVPEIKDILDTFDNPYLNGRMVIARGNRLKRYTTEKGKIKYPLYAKRGWGQSSELYKFIGVTNTEGVSNDPIYLLVPKKGYKEGGFNVVENSLDKSTYNPNNRVMYANVGGKEHYMDITEENAEMWAKYKIPNTNQYLNEKMASIVLDNENNNEVVNSSEDNQTLNKYGRNDDTLLRPISAVTDLTDGGVMMLENLVTGEFGSLVDIETGFYSLPNGDIIHIENLGGGKYYLDKTFGKQAPTEEEMLEILNKCKN